jgi:hypothetical protein
MPAIHHRYEAAQKPAADESVEIGIQLFWLVPNEADQRQQFLIQIVTECKERLY